jgi:hypothetical protein
MFRRAPTCTRALACTCSCSRCTRRRSFRTRHWLCRRRMSQRYNSRCCTEKTGHSWSSTLRPYKRCIDRSRSRSRNRKSRCRGTHFRCYRGNRGTLRRRLHSNTSLRQDCRGRRCRSSLRCTRAGPSRRPRTSACTHCPSRHDKAGNRSGRCSRTDSWRGRRILGSSPCSSRKRLATRKSPAYCPSHTCCSSCFPCSKSLRRSCCHCSSRRKSRSSMPAFRPSTSRRPILRSRSPTACRQAHTSRSSDCCNTLHCTAPCSSTTFRTPQQKYCRLRPSGSPRVPGSRNRDARSRRVVRHVERLQSPCPSWHRVLRAQTCRRCLRLGGSARLSAPR